MLKTSIFSLMKEKIAKISIFILRATVIFFAVIGFLLTSVFFAVKFGMTNVRGAIDFNDRFLARPLHKGLKSDNVSHDTNLCRALIIASVFPQNGSDILTAIKNGSDQEVISEMIRAIEPKVLALKPGASKDFFSCNTTDALTIKENGFDWMNTEEWKVFEGAVVKDESVIKRASDETNISRRTIVGMLLGEQLRLFNSEREIFKNFFMPLKVLGSETKFSLGVTGIKEETAKEIEANLKNKNSEFYPGIQFENMLDFKTEDHDTERIERLTAKDHYYSYLYTALFIKEIETQWTRQGYDVKKRPEILATIFNIGFRSSKPNSDPKVGGAVISIDDKSYTFGGLVYDFYYSGRLVDEFPY